MSEIFGNFDWILENLGWLKRWIKDLEDKVDSY